MTKASLKLVPFQNEYLSFVFYFSGSPDLNTLGKALHELIVSSVQTVVVPAAELRLYPQAYVGPRAAVSKLGRGSSEEGYSFLVKGVSSRDKSGLDILLNLPEDTGRILVDCERRDPATKEWMLVWSVGWHPKDEPSGDAQASLDARLDLHFHVTLFSPSEDVWWENHEGDEEFVECIYDERARVLVDKIVSVLGSLGGVYTGNVEVVREAETARGMYYLNPSLAQRAVPWHRQIEHALWANAGPDRSSFVRRVTWGTYLGPDIARRLDPNGRWIEEFARYHVNPNVEEAGPQWFRRFVKGSLFLAASANPLEVSQWNESGIGMIEAPWITAAWLHREFNKAGVLL